MNWKFIFNSNHLGAGTSLDTAIDLANKSGYKFLSWNGEILFVNGDSTGINTEDCY